MNTELKLISLRKEMIPCFKKEMQKAFQYSYEQKHGPAPSQVLPDADIEKSLHSDGAEAFEALLDGARVGGTIITIDKEKHRGDLDFLYVKARCQSNGIGQFIWNTIEHQHLGIRLWETMTPYFDERNIYFYVNRCGFHIVEFFNSYHPDQNMPEGFDGNDGMFKLKKTSNEQ